MLAQCAAPGEGRVVLRGSQIIEDTAEPSCLPRPALEINLNACTLSSMTHFFPA